MRPIIRSLEQSPAPEEVAVLLRHLPGFVLLRSHNPGGAYARYSLVTAHPFQVFRSWGSTCQTLAPGENRVQFGNPWSLMQALLARYELLDEPDFPLPLGGCFGYWGYDLKNFLEPKLTRRARNDLDLPDCFLGFYDSLVAFDHELGRTHIIATGLGAHGSRSPARARQQLEYWESVLSGRAAGAAAHAELPLEGVAMRPVIESAPESSAPDPRDSSCISYPEQVRQLQAYIRQGDIYQANLAHRLEAGTELSPWDLFQNLCAVSPAPFAAYLNCGPYQLLSSSPELFLRMSGSYILTRPIKGTRPRSSDPARDAQLAYELQTSSKEIAELIMITDLLRNDLGRICDYGSVAVPELLRLESFSHVHHLISTVTGRLRPGGTHLDALAATFPGGSITGAPKIRAMQLIDQLEPLARGPYTGALGYIGFNRESQLSIIIRTAIHLRNRIYFHAGAGIVADSNPEAEYQETLAKAAGFLDALRRTRAGEVVSKPA